MITDGQIKDAKASLQNIGEELPEGVDASDLFKAVEVVFTALEERTKEVDVLKRHGWKSLNTMERILSNGNITQDVFDIYKYFWDESHPNHGK